MKYGICAVIALLHDVLVLWGAFAIAGKLFGWQVDSLFVTAMLTVIGFSVHDTIIVFDRIRENLQRRQKGETFSDLTDRSIDPDHHPLDLHVFHRRSDAAGPVLLRRRDYSSVRRRPANRHHQRNLFVYLQRKRSAGSLEQRDQTYALLGPSTKSGLGARPTSLAPGDRPLVTPRPVTQTSGGDANGDAETPREPRPGAARRQPVRRRRM